MAGFRNDGCIYFAIIRLIPGKIGGVKNHTWYEK